MQWIRSAQRGLSRAVRSRLGLLAVCASCLLLPSAVALAGTTFLYGQGAAYNGCHCGSATTGFAPRDFNRAYHYGYPGTRWTARYIHTNGTSTEVTANTQPAAQNYYDGYAKAQCFSYDANDNAHEHPNASYACYSTRP